MDIYKLLIPSIFTELLPAHYGVMSEVSSTKYVYSTFILSMSISRVYM